MAGTPDTQNKKWLIIFLIYADFTTTNKPEKIETMKVALNSLLGEIITTPIDNRQSRMFVALNSVRYLPERTDDHIKDKTWLFTIQNSGNDGQNKISHYEQIDHSTYEGGAGQGDHPLQESDRILHILKETDLQPDEEVMLMTWDHGSSFGIFRQEPQTLTITQARTQFYAHLPQFPFLTYFLNKAKPRGLPKKGTADQGYISLRIDNNLAEIPKSPENIAVLDLHIANKTPFYYNEQTGHMAFQGLEDAGNGDNVSSSLVVTPLVPEILKNQELDAALKAWSPNRKVGVLLMYNCWMMNLHTMYALKDSVHCLVAPQGDIDIPGYNIKDILTYINTPGKDGVFRIEPSSLAKICVETFDNAYSKAKAMMLDRSEPDITEYFKVFAVDLSKEVNHMPALNQQITCLKNLVDLCVQEMSLPKPELKYFFKYIRSVCFEFSQGSTMNVDIINWVRSIRSASSLFRGKNLLLRPILTSPMQALLESVLLEENSIVLANSSGANVYLPKASSGDLATIQFPPTGYSLFFPIVDRSAEPKLKDNVITDGFLAEFPKWREFLTLLDPAIENIFVPDN
ncbi:MAG: hypothetical protein JWP94_494 [Mucilaginibacter sp.]|nr:hypothetical protein [Mucilaginibacter sp.]